LYKGTKLGPTVVDPFTLLPGDNLLDAEFRYQPDDANNTVAQEFIASFLTSTEDLPLSIHGSTGSSPFGSLQTALSHLQLETGLKGM
jgi:hypothetical protein